MTAFLDLPDLACETVGGAALACNDEFFAEKENLLREAPAIWKDHAYTDRGKWMDGWETRRRRPAGDPFGPVTGHDWCIVRLGMPGVIRGVVVDTAFFRGNFPESSMIHATEIDAPLDLRALDTATWTQILPRTALAGDHHNAFAIDYRKRFTHVKLEIFPDGGVARLRVHGEALPDWPAILRGNDQVDLVAVEHGGRALASSNEFYSSPDNLLAPGRGARMDDGWETRRRRGPGFDWAVLRLGVAGTVRRIEIDTAHFKGNYPDRGALEVCDARGVESSDLAALPWREILPETKLGPDQVHVLTPAVEIGPATHARLVIHPDGGVSRLRLFGTPEPEALRAAAVARLDALTPRAAEAALLDCCGSPEWVRRMRERRPFASAAELHATADLVWDDLDREQWLLAFRAHPEIGGTASTQGERGTAWSVAEQAGVDPEATATRTALAEANRAYRERFGHVFLVCATGKSGDEMLALCRERLANDPERELLVAAEEERKILHLRLDKLLAS